MGLTLSPKIDHGPLCGLKQALDELDDDDRALVESWMADDAVQHTQISRSLRDGGYSVSPTTVGRHRVGDCACGRTA